MIDARGIIDGLPPSRDDEPPSLRQDIADEILDHLQCGLRRELLISNGDEVSARKRVFIRFGDPQQIARTLWFQAMWSKIMTQRVLTGSAIVSMLISVTLVGMVGWMMRSQQKANAALFEQVAKLIPDQTIVPKQRDLRWNNLKIKVTFGSIDGPPGEGCSIQVSKVPGIGDDLKGGKNTHSAVLGKSGIDDCGFLEPGRYKVAVKTPWEEQAESEFMIVPGVDHIEPIVAPRQLPDYTVVSFNVEGLPSNLPHEGHVLVINFWPIGSRTIAGRSWTTASWAKDTPRPFLIVVPHYGTWISRVQSKSWQGNSYWIPEAVKDANWTKLESSTEWKLPVNQYRFTFDLVQVRGAFRPDQEPWKNSVITDNIPQLNYFSNQSILSAEAVKTNTWSIAVPDPVVELIDNPEKVQVAPKGNGTGFF